MVSISLCFSARSFLSSAYGYLKIAEVFREARQHDNALLWAEKGLEAFPEHTDGRLLREEGGRLAGVAGARAVRDPAAHRKGQGKGARPDPAPLDAG